MILLYAINLAFNIWFLVYLFNLEKKGCECSLVAQRTQLIIYIILNMFFGFLNLFPLSKLTHIVLYILSVVIAIIYIVTTLVWIFYLKRTKCACSKDPARGTMEVFAWIGVGVVLVAVVFLIVGGVTVLRARK